MHTSDSEDFESADEGLNDVNVRKERKKRLSSSNYSDCLEEEKKSTVQTSVIAKNAAETDGWDDFNIDDDIPKDSKNTEPNLDQITNKQKDIIESKKKQDTGWDDFDDWGQSDSGFVNIEKGTTPPKSPSSLQEDSIKSLADRLSATTVTETKSSGWGWSGWGVDSLLNTATAGISSITSHVSQGLSTVLESGIGAPDPFELARIQNAKNAELKANKDKIEADKSKLEAINSNLEADNIEAEGKKTNNVKENTPNLVPDVNLEQSQVKNAGDAAFPFGNLFSGVTKFVENTGTKVLAGGLGTLETIGKKTMEVLQDGDPGLAKKRAMLGLDTGEKIVLSQVLREAKTRADKEDKIREDKREAKEVHYETLFDDFEGLVHLEALEMLSKQVNMRIEERLRSVDVEKRQEIKETLQQVAELCEMPDEDEEECESCTDPDMFLQRLQEATQDLGLKLQFQPLVQQFTETLKWLDNSSEDITHKALYKKAVSGLAQSTALCVELYHKTGEMLLVKERRSTADEADAMTQMTVVLTRHLSDLATRFTERLNSLPSENKEQINTYITNVFLESGNSSTYIQNAFQLALPILQIGAA